MFVILLSLLACFPPSRPPGDKCSSPAWRVVSSALTIRLRFGIWRASNWTCFAPPPPHPLPKHTTPEISSPETPLLSSSPLSLSQPSRNQWVYLGSLARMAEEGGEKEEERRRRIIIRSHHQLAASGRMAAWSAGTAERRKGRKGRRPIPLHISFFPASPLLPSPPLLYIPDGSSTIFS